MTVDNVSSILEKKRINPEWFSAKAQLSYKDNNQKISFTSTIISEREKAFWMNAKKFGFEAGRFMFRSDSLYAIDRLNKQYLKDNINSLSQKIELPNAFVKELSVRNLQDIFMGNSLQSIIPYTEITPLEGHYLLSGSREGVISTLLVRKNDLVPMEATFTQGDLEVRILYKDHRLHSGFLFSHNRIIQMNSSDDQININLIYSNLDMITPKEITFSIPPRYSKMKF